MYTLPPPTHMDTNCAGFFLCVQTHDPPDHRKCTKWELYLEWSHIAVVLGEPISCPRSPDSTGICLLHSQTMTIAIESGVEVC